MKYRLQRGKAPDTWSVVDLRNGRSVLADESYTVADQLCCYLNGHGPGVAAEIREMGQSIEAARS